MAGIDSAAINGIARAGGLFGAAARAQYTAMAQLRWSIFSHSLRSSKGALELGARTVANLLYAALGLAIGLGAGAGSYLIASNNAWEYVPIVFWAMCFLWQMVPIMLASFQEQFDLGILLRFPVRFGSYMLLYLVFGLLDISTILGSLACLGIWIGVAVARPDLLGWTTLSLAVFAVFNILLVRTIFVWIDRWLAQRRTREILGAVFMLGLLSLQLLNPALYQKRHARHKGADERAEQLREAQARYEPVLEQADAVQQWLPPGLAAQALRQGVEHDALGSLTSLDALGLYAVLVGGLLALRLKAEYRGENLGSAPARAKAAPSRGRAVSPGYEDKTARSLVGSGPIAAVIEKDVRSLLRTLPLLYAIGAPLLLVLVFSGVFIHNGGGSGAPVFPLSLPVCMVYAQLGFTQIFYNSLGTEGAGIQLYFLSPTPIRTVLLAKNLLHSCLFALVALVAGVLAGLRLGIPDPAVIAATAAWVLFSLPCNLAAGNIFSLKMPYRVNPGRISRQRGSQANALLSLLVQLCVLAVGAAVFAVCWHLDRMGLATPVFLVLAVAAFFVWRRVLSNVDAIAYQRRDTLMATLMKTD
jgi:ABC-2 type transport system permease protein